MSLRKHMIVKPGTKARLAQRDPDITPGFKDKESSIKQLEKNTARLAELQYLLYAENRRAVLVIFQALDAGGKDGTIRHVMSGLNPQGCRVTSFKVPSAEESRHDFLWRIHKAVPQSGELGIFNRSHYEDVLVVRVHRIVPKEVWSRRYEEINAFEKQLTENRVTILKFFLHISKEEQKKRFEERLSDPTKNWKLSEADFEERKFWDDYQAAYEDALSRCSTPWAPWHVIPADHKWFRNAAVSHILVEALEELDMKFPAPSIEVSRIRIH
ncbi:MAG TPA: polyphosphate kinase 2 family protein [Acidobacteriota bacterium]|nr:polyphosphate kinase 2 family protein [Acidobacteriota bacterium]